MARYLGSCRPCCSAIQKRGDIAVDAMSEFVMGTGLDYQPLRCSFQDISQHLFLRALPFTFAIDRMVSLFRLLNPVRRCCSFFDAIVFLAAITSELAIAPVIFIPLAKSLGREASGYCNFLTRNVINGMCNKLSCAALRSTPFKRVCSGLSFSAIVASSPITKCLPFMTALGSLMTRQ